jgi:hypothetical protein
LGWPKQSSSYVQSPIFKTSTMISLVKV